MAAISRIIAGNGGGGELPAEIGERLG
jgi:hypothetical protein